MRLSGTKATAIHQYRGLGNQLWDLAGNRPSLDLPFAETKSLVDATTGTNLVDFTRASSGTYVGSDGLIKTATTNLLLRSEEFDQLGAGGWSTISIAAFGSGSIANATIAPDGALTADKIAAASGTNTPRFFQSKSGTGVYTFSVYAKAAEADCVFVAIYTGSTYKHLYYDLSNESIVSVTASDYSVVNVGNEWFRLSVTETTSNPFANISFGLSNAVLANAGAYFLGDGTSGIYLWGAQLEQSSTVGEYVKTTSTINSAPRFDHDPTTGESLGLLVEEQRQNLMTSSSDIAGYFTEQNSTPTSNATTAPDGTTTADLIVPNTTLASHASFNTSLAFAASTTYSYSIFVKPNGYTWLQLTFTSGFNNLTAWVNFDLTGAGSFGFAGGGELSKDIEAYPNGWYRCTMTATSGSSPSGGGLAYLVLDSNRNARDANYAGNDTSGVYLWGAQLEAGSFPTSYIPTKGSAVTRAADVASISGSNFSSWYRQDEGTFSYQWKVPSATAPCNIFSVSDETTNNRHQHYSENNSIIIRTASSGVASNNGVGTSSADTFTRVSFGYGSGTTSASNNGTAITTSTQVIPVNITTAYLGASANGTVGEGTTLSRLTYWPARLPDETLQGITQ